jgi:hypothetical protein
MTRRGTIISIVTVVLAAVIVSGVLVVSRTQQRRDDVEQADRVAVRFDHDLSKSRIAVESALTGTSSDHADRVQTAFEAAVSKTPRLGPAPAWGRRHSQRYARAAATQKALQKKYARVSVALDQAVVGQPFVTAALAALADDPGDFVPDGGTLPNGSALRERMIPGFERALAKFERVEVPQGQAATARKVRSALKTIVASAEHAADDLDAGRAASVDARKEYLAATGAVYGYRNAMRDRLNAAITEAVADVNRTAET